jgi:hypothetical protein
MSARYNCPACGQEGEHEMEDQARCLTPTCRVTTFQTTTPPSQGREQKRLDALARRRGDRDGAAARRRPGR